MEALQLQVPFSKDVARSLRCGDLVELSGTVYTARDAAHARLAEALEHGTQLPFPLDDQLVYYAGPSPAKPGAVIGSCGPTTSGRMDSYTPLLIEHGLRAMLGKGPRSMAVVDAMREHACVYFAAIGGAAALGSTCIEEAEVIAYEDLGPEAIRRLKLLRYPCVVAIDAAGNNIYETGPASYRALA